MAMRIQLLLSLLGHLPALRYELSDTISFPPSGHRK